MSAGEIRPPRVTAVASTTIRAAPPTARLPRWTRCQSLHMPSSALYWHMGDMTIRLRKVTPRRVSGVRRAGERAGRSLMPACYRRARVGGGYGGPALRGRAAAHGTWGADEGRS